MKRIAIALFGFAFFSLVQSAAQADEVPGEVDFSRDIRPLLSEYCFQCHGPDQSEREADLRLDTKEGAFSKRFDYHIIVPGKPEQSEMYLRISGQKSSRMPPRKFEKRLKPEQIALIKTWIEQGAPWQDHWAFIAPQRPPLPKVKNEKWTRTPIDYFILSRLEKAGLTPNEEADKRTLIRRVTLDLTGLPPTLAEVDTFVNDESPDAYEKVVDRLLSSKRYGEHMARFWLDAVRYGDTHGLHLDNYREMWPYREWVINAYNNHMRFDKFVLDQLAGDLLPNPSLDQLVATGFNRAHVTTNEGGSIREEVFVRNVTDRVVTTGTVFMGMTFDCARCHDHKYDPISQEEFYQMFAFFNSLDGSPLDGNRAQHPPVAKLPNREQKELMEQYQEQIASARKGIAEHLTTITYKEPAKPKNPTPPEPKVSVWIEDDLPAGAAPSGPWQWVTKPKELVFSGKRSHRQTAKKLDQHFFTNAKPPLHVSKGDKLFTYVYLDPKNPPKQIMLQWNDGKWEHRAYWGENRIPFGQDGTPSRRNMGKLPPTGKWVRLEVDAAHVNLKPGDEINGWAFTQFGGTVYWDHAGILSQYGQDWEFDSLAQWEEIQRKLKTKLPSDIAAVLEKQREKRTGAEQKRLTDYFVENVYSDTRKIFDPLHEQIAKAEKQISELEKKFATTLIWKETAKPRPAYLLKRGEYHLRGDQVARKTPAALPPMPKDLSRDRLGLAKWLLRPEHPLTARVAVNRYWQNFFGKGIVLTSEDFGNQGESPSHPKLLDWLAVEFREKGWDIQHIQKLIVNSATYRQSSHVTPSVFARDPSNRLLGRGPRVRLDAEVLRDQALMVSGLLVEQVGGPSVKPPQPKGLWFVVGYSGSNTVRFKKDTGADKIYRRSLYTFWKRTAPPPQMNILDAPSRESCVVRRERTNTPLQALMLMNDPQYVEAARHLAQRLLLLKGKSDEERAAHGFHLATARPPTKMELAEMMSLLDESRSEFRKNAKAAEQLIRVGESTPEASLGAAELASWTMVANLILNLDEVIMKN